MFVWPDVTHIYLAPHLDDVVLSCGALIYRQIEDGEMVAVITIFTASPPAAHPLSDFAGELHKRWQSSAPPEIDFSDPFAVRREEDRRAFATISPQIEIIHLPLMDCIYRQGADGQVLYPDMKGIFGAVHPDDPARVALQDMPPFPAGALLYAPLAVGNHVDHQLTCQAVHNQEIDPARVSYYADYPYAGIPGMLEARIGADDPDRERLLVPVDEAALRAKVRAIAEHRSQINTFWQNVEQMAETLRRYHQEIGGELYFKAGKKLRNLRINPYA